MAPRASFEFLRSMKTEPLRRMNQPRKGTCLRSDLAVTLQYLGNMAPSMHTSSSVWWLPRKTAGRVVASTFRGVVYGEDDARGGAHGILEAAGDGPLGDLLVADEGEDDGGNGAKDGGGEEGDVRCQDAGDEAGAGHGQGQHVEEGREAKVADEELGEVAQDGGHGDGFVASGGGAKGVYRRVGVGWSVGRSVGRRLA